MQAPGCSQTETQHLRGPHTPEGSPPSGASQTPHTPDGSLPTGVDAATQAGSSTYLKTPPECSQTPMASPHFIGPKTPEGSPTTNNTPPQQLEVERLYWQIQSPKKCHQEVISPRTLKAPPTSPDGSPLEAVNPPRNRMHQVRERVTKLASRMSKMRKSTEIAKKNKDGTYAALDMEVSSLSEEDS